jgi:hypothetical protein
MNSFRTSLPFFGLSLTLLAWSFFTLRQETLILSLAFCTALFFPKFHNSKAAIVAGFSIAFISSLSPIGITTQNASGTPRLINCCPWGPPSQYSKLINAGQCHYCTDLVTGFEAKRYLAW